MMKLIINSLYKNKEVSRSETENACTPLSSQGKQVPEEIAAPLLKTVHKSILLLSSSSWLDRRRIFTK